MLFGSKEIILNEIERKIEYINHVIDNYKERKHSLEEVRNLINNTAETKIALGDLIEEVLDICKKNNINPHQLMIALQKR